MLKCSRKGLPGCVQSFMCAPLHSPLALASQEVGQSLASVHADISRACAERLASVY